MSIGPGSRLGPYEVTALIGEGGMGKVWRAHHTGLKRDDALKAGDTLGPTLMRFPINPLSRYYASMMATSPPA